MTPTSSGRIEAIDGLRGWAVALVFLVHFCGAYALHRRGVNFDQVIDVLALAPANALLYWLFYSHHGVQIFFAISGFVITRSFIGNRTLSEYLTFVRHRILRIYPAFLVALALALALSAYFNGAQSIQLVTIAENLVFLNGVFALEIPGYDFPTWSLLYEFVFYLVFPLLYIVALRIGRNPQREAPLLWLGFLVLLALALFKEWLFFLPFFCGALAGLQSDATRGRIAQRLSDTVLVGAYVLTTTVAFLFVPLSKFGTEGSAWFAAAPIYVLALSIISALVIIRISHAVGFLYKWLTSAPMLALGRISFSFFLVHVLVLQAAFGLTNDDLHGSLVNAALMFAYCFLGSYALAALLYRIAEEPYYRFRRYATQVTRARRRKLEARDLG